MSSEDEFVIKEDSDENSMDGTGAAGFLEVNLIEGQVPVDARNGDRPRFDPGDGRPRILCRPDVKRTLKIRNISDITDMKSDLDGKVFISLKNS